MRKHGERWVTRLFVLFTAVALISACTANMGTGVTPTTDLGVPATGDETPTAAVPAEEASPTPQETPTTTELETETPADSEATPTVASVDDPGEVQETPAAQDATGFPDPAGFTWTQIVSGLSQPLDLSSPADGSGRLFIVEQPGVIRIYQDGQLLDAPFLDIRSLVGSGGFEQGLLGIAFHPNFSENGFFYLNYTDRIGDTVIARYQASSGDENTADPDSAMILMQIPQPYGNHNGGGMVMGPDGYLYISTGDGGSGGDPQNNAQNVNNLLGKILRIDVDSQEPYAIPEDNPFAQGGGAPEIWSYGLRNPWRFSFDRLTGDMYIADVGQNAWEEVNFEPAGAEGGINYGWNFREGANPFRGQPPAGLELVDPVYEFPQPEGCSITGGYVYRGEALSEFNGIYLFSDFCAGWVRGLLQDVDGNWQAQELFQLGLRVTSFGEDQQGELYLMAQNEGSVYRLDRAGGVSGR
jgi:glucose/arabinose dehydrogenase